MNYHFGQRQFTACILVISLISSPAYAAETVIRTKCENVFSTIFLDPKKDDVLAGIRFATLPPEVSSVADQAGPSTFALFNHLPTNETEYKAVFETTRVTRANQSEIAGARALKSDEATPRIEKGKKFADIVDQHLAQQQERIIIFVGHNEGGDFRFRDGSDVGIGKIVESCAVAGKMCVFISCHSKVFTEGKNSTGTAHELSFAEAQKIYSQLSSFLMKHKDEEISLRQVSTVLSKAEVSTKRRTRVTYLVLKGCGAAASLIGLAILIEFLDDCGKPGKLCPEKGK